MKGQGGKNKSLSQSERPKKKQKTTVSVEDIFSKRPDVIEELTQIAEECEFNSLRLISPMSPDQEDAFNLLVKQKNVGGDKFVLRLQQLGDRIESLLDVKVTVTVEENLDPFWKHVIKEAELLTRESMEDFFQDGLAQSTIYPDTSPGRKKRQLDEVILFEGDIETFFSKSRRVDKKADLLSEQESPHSQFF